MAISDEELAGRHKISVDQVRLLRQTRGATNETLSGLSAPALQRAIRRLNYPDLPRLRHVHQLAQARDDRGRIAPDAVDHAVHERARMVARSAAPTRSGRALRVVVAGVPVADAPVLATRGGPAPAAGIALPKWEWLGPGNVGGRTRGLVVHPKDPQRLWAGSAGGGIWHSADGGASWAPVDDFMANLAVCCLAIDRKKPNVLYAGTGEGFFNADALRGAGVFRTTDGSTWKQLPATATADFNAVNRIAVSPSGTVVIAATPTGLWRSSDAARAKWTKVLAGQIADVKFHPTLSTRAVAGSLDQGQAWFTSDGGKTWKPAAHATPWTGRVELAYARKNPAVVYASVQMSGGEVWRSSDGGKTYAKRATRNADGQDADYLGDQGWYGNVVWAGDPTDENLVILGGVDLWRSTDGGDTLHEISTWWDDRSAHADHHAICPDPGYNGTTNRRLYFGNDGGVHRADDLAQLGSEAQPPYVRGWAELNNRYGVTQFYAGAGHAGSGKIVGGAQDNGTLCFDPAVGSEGWRTIFGGDGGWCAADPTDPKVFYGEYVYLNIHRNTDGGRTSDTAGDRYISGQFWNPAAGEWAWKPLPFRIPDAMNQNALFIAPFVLDPGNPNRLLGGGLSLWETTNAKAPNTLNAGPRWRSVKLSVGAPISAIAIGPQDPAHVWVGHDNGMLFRSANATAATPAWQRADHQGPKPLTAARFCTRITIDPADPLTVYVCFGGFVADNVWVTRDGGARWAALANGLPSAPVKGFAVHPRRTAFLYAGTEVGLFVSEDRGANWVAGNQGPANVAVDDLFWMGETLVCATHGRGMYRIDLRHV